MQNDKKNQHPSLIQKILQQSTVSQKSKNTTLSNQSSQPIQMTINLGDNQQVKIYLRKNDDPITVSKKFCFQQNLNPKLINILAKKIKQFAYQSNNSQNYSPNITQNSTHVFKKLDRINTQFNRTTTQKSLKQNNHNNVYQRLFNQSKKTKGTKPDQAQFSQTNNKSFNTIVGRINNGVLIYQKNTRLSEQHRKKIERRLQQLKNLKDQQYTFKPQINQVSKLMVQKMRQQLGSQSSVYQRKQELKNQKMLKFKRQKQKNQIQQCTFQPKINNKQQRHQISRSTDRFNTLYEDSNLRQIRRQNTKLEYSRVNLKFHPQVNKLSEIIVNGVSFQDRLKKYQHQKFQKIKQTKKSKFFQQVKDQKGVKLYIPKTGRPPNNRKLQGLTVYDHLYNHRLKRQQTLEKIRSSSNPKIINKNQKSQKIYQINKIRSIQQIFNILDSDGDRLISATKINISSIDPKILKIIAPLLAQMQQIDVQLDQQQFIQSTLKLFNSLNPNQKHLILAVNKNKKQQQLQLSQPLLNQKSLQIANNQRSRIRPGVSLYQYGELKKNQKMQKINEQKQMKQLMELEECTFQPNLFRYKK